MGKERVNPLYIIVHDQIIKDLHFDSLFITNV